MFKTRVTENLKRVGDLTQGDRCRFFTEEDFRTVASVTTTNDCVAVTLAREFFQGLSFEVDVNELVEGAV